MIKLIKSKITIFVRVYKRTLSGNPALGYYYGYSILRVETLYLACCVKIGTYLPTLKYIVLYLNIFGELDERRYIQKKIRSLNIIFAHGIELFFFSSVWLNCWLLTYRRRYIFKYFLEVVLRFCQMCISLFSSRYNNFLPSLTTHDFGKHSARDVLD